MKGNKSCKGENRTGKHPPPVYSRCALQKLEILHLIAVLDIREVSGNYTYTLRCKEMINCTPREFASSGIRVNEKRRERERQGKDVKGTSWTPGVRGRGREGINGVWRKAVGTIRGSQMVAVKEPKRVKKPRACRPQTRLEMEVSTLVVASPLLCVLPYMHARVVYNHLCFVRWG